MIVKTEQHCQLCGETTEYGQEVHEYCVKTENIRANYGRMCLPDDEEVGAMTKTRDGLYVWITWLSKLMAGEVKCVWAPWFRTRYTGYRKAPSDFQLAVWTVEHTQHLNELIKERSALGVLA